MIQGNEEKNNATSEMMMEMRRMFDEKFHALEKENNALKQKAGRYGQSKTKRNSIIQSRKTREESEVKIVDNSTKSLESSATSSSKTVSNSRKTSQQEERSNSKRKEKETEKVINRIELNEKMIEEVIRRIGRVLT